MTAAVEVLGAKEMRAALKAADGKWPKELSKAHRTVAREVQVEAKAFAVGTGPMQAHWASAITAQASAAAASVGVRPKANAAFWGSKKATGWNDGWFKGEHRPRASSTPNNPPWVGNAWPPGGAGGPYAINDAIRHDLPKIELHLWEAVEAVYRQAFPN